jgi:transaldolase
MKFFIDTADIEEIRHANQRGWVDGVTTNPSLIAKSGRDFHEVIKDICKEVTGPVSAEVIGLKTDEMVKEGITLAKLASNVGIKTNVTLVFSPMQALLVAKAGGTMVSPFVGRLDDIGVDGLDMVSQIIQIYQNYDFETEVLVASVRSPLHIQHAAEMGADIATIPFKVMQQMTHHPLTDKGIKMFMDDWNKGKK